MAAYLAAIVIEAGERGYTFNAAKIGRAGRVRMRTSVGEIAPARSGEGGNVLLPKENCASSAFRPQAGSGRGVGTPITVESRKAL